MHIIDIARKTKADPFKLCECLILKMIDGANADVARVLRYLATLGIFKEVTPEVYAANRLSSVLEKGKDIDSLNSE